MCTNYDRGLFEIIKALLLNHFFLVLPPLIIPHRHAHDVQFKAQQFVTALSPVNPPPLNI